MQSTVVFHTNKTVMDKLEQHCGELPGDQFSWLVATLRLNCVNSGWVPVARARTVGHQEIRQLVLENVGVRSSVRTPSRPWRILADLGGPWRTLADLGGPRRTSADLGGHCGALSFRHHQEKCLPTWSCNPPRMVWKSIREWFRDLSLSVSVSLCRCLCLCLTIPSIWVPLSVSAVPVMVMFALPSHACNSTAHHHRHKVSRFSHEFSPMLSLSKQRPCDHVRNLLLSLLCLVCCSHPIERRPCSHMLVPPKWEHTPLVHQLPTKGMPVPPKRESTQPPVQTHMLDAALSQSLGL